MTRKEAKDTKGSFAVFAPFRGFRVPESPPTRNSTSARPGVRLSNARGHRPAHWPDRVPVVWVDGGRDRGGGGAFARV